MIKRFLYVGLFAVVCLGLVGIIFLKKMNKITPIEVLQAVPDDALVFIEEIDYEYVAEKFLPGSRIWVDFVNTTGRNGLDSIVRIILTHTGSSETLRDLLLKEGLSVSLHLQGKDQLTPLVYIPYVGYHNDHEFEQIVLGLLGEESIVNERKYESETLFDVSGNPEAIPGKFTFACVNGICLAGPSSMLVEQSVRTIHAGVDPLDKELEKLRATAGRYVHANIYINYSRVHMLFYPFLGEESWPKLLGISRLASRGELDLDIKEDALILNGMSVADTEETLLLDAFASQSPVKMELHEMMPSGTSSFLHLGVSDRKLFGEQMVAYLSGLGKWAKIGQEKEKLQKQYGFDPLEDLVAIMDDELAWFSIEGVTNHPREEIFVVETRSQSEASEVVMHWIEQYLQVHAFDMKSYRHQYKLDNQTSFTIYRMPTFYPKGVLPDRLFNSYVTIYENYLLFGPSVGVLSRVIYQNILHKTFVSDPVFKEMSDYLSNRSNVTFFFRPYPYLDYRREILNGETSEKLEAMELFLRRIPGVVVQYSSEDEMFYHSISGKYTSQIREKALTVWESLMDSTAITKPALVVNHNTREKEIFIQDASNKIYLINSTGRILWEQRLEGPMLGGMHQVDFYKNGKLQYMFNTAGKLHLIDRNGNYVERYPVSLRSEATAPLALFDYDKSRDYRIFIPGVDRKIYLYDIEGNVVTGWKFGKTESVVTAAPQHFRIGDRDYILVKDKTRAYFLDRRGKERIKTGKRVVFSEGNPFTLDMNIMEERPRWISTDTSGSVIGVYQDGSVSILLEQLMSGEHFFRMQDMDKDGVPDYIFAEGDELSVLKQDGTRLFTYRVRDRISEMPEIYKFSAADTKIGITDRSRKRIYLINADGSLYEGFPLEGTTRFSIGYFAGSDSRFNLIVGSANNFLYNYSIE
ncbi:MAG: hypothetical protein GY790_15905 [Bacteroidetes bacterium]|nr:hypothetical protein [Bacteroidota bacterium]